MFYAECRRLMRGKPMAPTEERVFDKTFSLPVFREVFYHDKLLSAGIDPTKIYKEVKRWHRLI